MISETHMPQGELLIRDILDRARHDGCGARGVGGTSHRHRGQQQADPANRAALIHINAGSRF
jgi:hypothetical protein